MTKLNLSYLGLQVLLIPVPLTVLEFIMKTSTYTLAGIAALVLAVLFPIYWLHGLAHMSLEAMREDLMTLTGWDLLFVVIGALEIFVYLALAQHFRDQLGGALTSILLVIMAVMVAVFHATIIVDVLLGLGLATPVADTLVSVGLIVSVVSWYLYAIPAAIFAIVLLVRFADVSILMRLFAVGLLIACILQLTVLLAVINTFLFPALMVVLAVHFLRGEHRVEVV